MVGTLFAAAGVFFAGFARFFAGARIRMKGRVKGPWHVVGEPRQHAFTITGPERSVAAT